jgi:Mg2+/Co2+ transporter CorB
MVVSVNCWVADRGLSYFSSSETVLTAASDARMRQLANKGNKRAKIVEKLRAVGEAETDATLPETVQNIASDAYFIPETTLLFDQLQAFRSRREHFAVVVDEYGDFRGIVTLEDILEEIVGDIDDEHDIDLAGLTPQADGSWLVDGNVTIRDLNRALGWQLPDEDASTLAGLLLVESRTIPSSGQEFRFHDIRFRIVKRKGNRLTQIRLWAK